MLRPRGQQFRDADPESQSKDFERAERNVALFTLHRTDVRAVELAKIGQFLLRQSVIFSIRTDIFGKRGTY